MLYLFIEFIHLIIKNQVISSNNTYKFLIFKHLILKEEMGKIKMNSYKKKFMGQIILKFYGNIMNFIIS